MSNPAYPCLNRPPDAFCPATPTYPARECTSGCSWWGSQYTGNAWPTGWGNAMDWPDAARKAKYTVSAVPQPNSIMCIPPNQNGAGPKGHVAFVTGPAVNGHVPVIEMNFLIEYGYDFRNEAPVGGCQFIYLVGKPDPPPPPASSSPKEKDMYMVLVPNGTVYLVYGFVSKHAMTQPGDVSTLAAAGIPYKATACSNEFYQFLSTLPNV